MYNQFYNKDNMEGLKELEANSIDCMITDPPYGYSFMNKGWDKVLPPIDTWKECLRVLKPGAFAFVMSAPRQDVLSRMIINLEDAGFKTGFTSIYWTYASGFPKALNIGKKTENDNLSGAYAGFNPKPAVEVIIVAMKLLNQKNYVDQALYNGKGVAWLDDCRVPYQSDDDKSIVPQPIFNSPTGKTYGFKTGVGRNGKVSGTNGGRFPANLIVSDDVLNDGNITKSKSALMGSGVDNVKPANVYGTYQDIQSVRGHDDEGSFSRFFDLDSWWGKNITDLPYEAQKTFPWLIVPKASSGEKNEGLDGFEEKETTYGSGGGAMPSSNDNGIKTKTKNVHPTVKPLKLMSYLVTLGTRTGDIILDPYGGSGTTGIAAYRLKRQFILFESEPEYHEIAEARLKNETKTIEAFDKW